VDPTGKFAYVACYGSDNLYGYSIDATTGALRPLPGSPFADIGSGPEGVVLAPSGKFAYVPNSFAPPYFPDDFVAAYAIDATRGTLTPVAGSPFKVVGRDDQGLAVDAASKFVYVTSVVNSDISAFAIDPISGALRKVKGSPFADAGSEPIGIAVCRVTVSKCIPAAL
jgi:6-phosphogluconolactonase